MRRNGYDGPDMYRPMGAWAYVGYALLFSLPVVGLVLLIVFSLSNANINRRNYARSYFCWLLLCLIALVILVATGAASGGWTYLQEMYAELRNSILR